MAEASNFKIGMLLGFARAHHKITHRRKSGRGRGLVKPHKILGFPFNISAMAEASDFKIGMQLAFPKPNHKITPSGKVGVAWC